MLKERLDYTLREGYMESNYWSAVTSHVSYWTSCDVARFILENCLDLTPDEGESMQLSWLEVNCDEKSLLDKIERCISSEDLLDGVVGYSG